MVRQDIDNGGMFWCPVCERGWKQADTKPPHTMAGLPLAAGILYEGRLFPDATISWHTKFQQISLADARVVSSAIQHLESAAHDLETHIRGADRFVFVKDPLGWFAMYQDSTCLLVKYTVGTSRREHRTTPACDACHKPLVTRTTAYKPGPKSSGNRGYYSWSTTRICAVCVETPAPSTGLLGPLVTE